MAPQTEPEPTTPRWVANLNDDSDSASVSAEGDDYSRWWDEVTGERSRALELKRFVNEHVHSKMPKADEENKLWDKFVFVSTVCQVSFLSIACASEHVMPLMPWYFVIMTPILMLFRYFQYHQRKHHYFMLDFCYWAQLITMVYLLAFPTNAKLFLIIFSLSHGPLAWTIPTYRNSLVFHSMDRFTSVYIHYAPLLVCYVIRSYPKDAAKYWYVEFEVEEPSWNPDSPNYDFVTPFCIAAFGALGVYELWQTMYAFIVGQFSKRFGTCMTVYHDKEKMTLYRWTSQSGKGWLYNLVMCAGPKYSWWVWVGMNFGYTMLVCLPTYGWYLNFVANTAFAIFIFVSAVWNGANFYIEAYAKIQWKRMERKKKKNDDADVEAANDASSEDADQDEEERKKTISCNPMLTNMGGPATKQVGAPTALEMEL